MLEVFTTFGVKFQEKAGSVKLAESLNLLNSTNLVVKTRRVIDASEPFGFKLFFETSLLLTLV
jgi:hypothetical protein